MKKKLVAILLVVVSIFTITLTQLPALADEEVTLADLEQCNEQISEVLTEYDTSVEEQLNIIDTRYTELLESDNISINQTNNVTTLKNFNRNLYACTIVNSELSTYSLDNDSLAYLTQNLPEILHKATLNTLAGIFSLFNLGGWYLTAELLNHAVQPTTHENETYIPVYGYIVKQTDYFKEIANGSITDSKTQLTDGEEIKFPEKIAFGVNGDVYYAIHGFDYKKPTSTSKTVIIEDYYDFKVDKNHQYGLFMNAVVCAIDLLHSLNLFTYYYINITESLSESLTTKTDTWGYQEEKFSLEANELKDYEVSFPTTGRRLIQTLGTGTTDLHILDEKGKTLAYDKGSGYEGNALISFNFQKDKKYVIRVADTDRLKNDNIKLCIFNDNRNISNFAELNLSTVGKGNYSGSATANQLYMVKLNPQNTEKYKIKFTFENEENYCAYLICLDSASEGYSTAFYHVAINPPHFGITNEDMIGGGSSEKNIISKSLTAGCQYLLIVCGKPANSDSLQFNFSVTA